MAVEICVRCWFVKMGLEKLMMRYLLVPHEEKEEMSRSTEDQEMESRRLEDWGRRSLNEKA